MAISSAGTFDYVFPVSEHRTERLEGGPRRPMNLGEIRLLGSAPTLMFEEYAPTAWQLYARVTLTATNRQDAQVGSASFAVERGLVRVLRPGDVLHLSRTACGGLGLSILRDDLLVAAAGAINYVPLGADAAAAIPFRDIERAEAILRMRDPQSDAQGDRW